MTSIRAASLALVAVAGIGACSSVGPTGQPGVSASGVKPVASNQAVLDALDTLTFRPLHTLSPAEARQQPTFADGVKAVLGARGQAAPPDAITARDINIAGAAGPLHAKVLTPGGGATPKPLIVCFHGGGFVVADIDPVRSEGEMLVERLKAAGVQVETRTYAGVTHEFFGADAVIAEAKQAQAFAGERLKQAFTTR